MNYFKYLGGMTSSEITDLAVKQALQHEVMCTWWAAEAAGDDLASFAERLGTDLQVTRDWLLGTGRPDMGALLKAQLTLGSPRGMGYLYERYIATREGNTL